MSRTIQSKETRRRGKSLAQRVQLSRQKKGWTQAHLSRQANIPIDTIRSIENARVRVPGVFVIHDLSCALGSDIKEWLKKD